MAAKKNLSHETISVLKTRLEGQVFGIDIRYISDIIPNQKATLVPRASAGVAGLINLRGHIVTLLNAGKVLDIVCEENEAANIVVIDIDGHLYGILFDAVADIIELSRADLGPINAVLNEGWSNLAEGVFRLQSELLILLDVKAFIAAACEQQAA